MRNAEKQEEFLKRGRFGEGEETLARTKVDPLFYTGLLSLLTAVVAILVPGGYYSLLAFVALGVTGVLLCISGVVRMRSRRLLAEH